MTLHSVRHDHHQDDSRTRQGAVMIPKLLQRYGTEIAALLEISEDMVQRFDALHRLESELREYGCTPPRPDLSPAMRAAWSQHKGEGFWER